MPTWKEVIAANPAHSQNFARKWKVLAAEGKDINGEARLIDAMAERGSRIFDAGCGTGRVGGELIKRGHVVSGVDVDPVLIAHAEHDFPEGTWTVGDLAERDERWFREAAHDLVVAAGNVLGFIAESQRLEVLSCIHDLLVPGGRFVTGLGSGRGWSFEQLEADAASVGLECQSRFSSWDLKPFGPQSTFLVAVFQRPGARLLG